MTEYQPSKLPVTLRRTRQKDRPDAMLFACKLSLRPSQSRLHRKRQAVQRQGFSIKSAAPAFMALTVISMVPWPEIMITGIAGLISLNC